MTEVRRIGFLSLAKMVGMIYFALGLIFFVCFGLVVFLANTNGEGITEAGLLLLFVCAMPVIYGAMGFIADAFIALVYNVLAGNVGGVELELVPQATAAAKSEGFG